MYTVSSSDLPRRVMSTPQSCVGAPCPVVLAEERTLRLAYYLEPERLTLEWRAAHVREPRPNWSDDLCAVVSFVRPYAHMFGPPNDEAFSGHPLAARGLEPYSVFEIEESSWLRTLVRMNDPAPENRISC